MSEQNNQDDSVIVSVSYTADVDADDAEEYADAHHPDADHVYIYDRVSGDDVLYRGARPSYICAECGREAHSIRSSGGTRVYTHGLDDKCEWEDPEWEPPEHHPDHPSNQKPWWREALGTAIGFAIPLLVVSGVLYLIPETTLTISEETVVFPPNSLAPAVIVLALTVFMIYVALKYAPGMAGGGVRR